MMAVSVTAFASLAVIYDSAGGTPLAQLFAAQLTVYVLVTAAAALTGSRL